jgi:hypothetical protein
MNETREGGEDEIDYIGFGSYSGNILIKVTRRNNSSNSSILHLFSRNGKFLAQQKIDSLMFDVYFSRLNDWIVTILENMKVVIHDGHSLEPITVFTLTEQIYNLSFNKKELAAFGGTEKGHLFILYSAAASGWTKIIKKIKCDVIFSLLLLSMSSNLVNSYFKLEGTVPGAKITGVHESLLQEAEKDILWYRDNFLGKGRV